MTPFTRALEDPRTRALAISRMRRAGWTCERIGPYCFHVSAFGDPPSPCYPTAEGAWNAAIGRVYPALAKSLDLYVPRPSGGTT